MPKTEHLKRLTLADVYLDTLVYNGHTTGPNPKLQIQNPNRETRIPKCGSVKHETTSRNSHPKSSAPFPDPRPKSWTRGCRLPDMCCVAVACGHDCLICLICAACALPDSLAPPPSPLLPPRPGTRHPTPRRTSGSDVLWAGVPMVTIQGDTFPSRVGASLARAMEMDEMIAYDLHEYEEKAVALGLSRDKRLEVPQPHTPHLAPQNPLPNSRNRNPDPGSLNGKRSTDEAAAGGAATGSALVRHSTLGLEFRRCARFCLESF
jgi:hypothetical protein